VLSESRQNQVRVRTWQGCRQNDEVVLYLMENWGHVWPGPYDTTDLDKENPLKDFDVATIIWDFFKSHPQTP
jgi:poly(3-hydroxybutyrate) depolymerase